MSEQNGTPRIIVLDDDNIRDMWNSGETQCRENWRAVLIALKSSDAKAGTGLRAILEQKEELERELSTLKQQLAEAQNKITKLEQNEPDLIFHDAMHELGAKEGETFQQLTYRIASELARYRAAEAGMPKLRRMKASTDGEKPFSVEFYDDNDVKNLRAHCIALEAKMKETAKDAERYKYLNKLHNILIFIEDENQLRTNVRLRCGPLLDDWIDRRTAEELAAAKHGEAE